MTNDLMTPRSSGELAEEIAKRMLFGQLYPELMCRVGAASYHYDTEQLVTAFGEALVREQGPLTDPEARLAQRLRDTVLRKVRPALLANGKGDADERVERDRA